MNATPLDWAEDTELLPIIMTPLSPWLPVHQLRDLSVLRSSSSYPFSSLQNRSKHRKNYRSHRYQSLFNYKSSSSPFKSYTSFKPPHQSGSPSSPSFLDWESDPRLTDLSRSLRALGWIRVP